MIILKNLFLMTIIFPTIVSETNGVEESEGINYTHEEGGIHNIYDESKWKDPYDALGAYDEQQQHQQQQNAESYRNEDNAPHFKVAKNTLHGNRSSMTLQRTSVSAINESKEKKEEEQQNVETIVFTESLKKEIEEQSELAGAMKHASVDDKAYFRHFIRLFTENFEYLEGEEHKYGVQLMMAEDDYTEIKQLLDDGSSNNKQILDLISKSFQPLSRSSIAPMKQYLTLGNLLLCLLSITLVYFLGLLCNNLLSRPFHFWRFSLTIFIVVFVFSVPWEWYRLYKVALSKKISDATKLSGIPPACRPKDLSIISSLKLWVADKFSMSNDDCERYHESILVDPLWEVTPMQALSVCCSRLFLEPLKQVASAGGECFRLFFKEVPMQWQPFLFIALFVIIVLIIVTQAGFKIWTPLLRLDVKNSAIEQGVETQRRLEVENKRMTEEIQQLQLSQARPIQAHNGASVLQRIENVGAQSTIEGPENAPRLSPDRSPQNLRQSSTRRNSSPPPLQSSSPGISPQSSPSESHRCEPQENLEPSFQTLNNSKRNEENNANGKQQSIAPIENEDNTTNMEH